MIDAACLNQDLTGLGQVVNFRYTLASVGPGGYDIQAMAINSALADHNYQIVTEASLTVAIPPAPGMSILSPFVNEK